MRVERGTEELRFELIDRNREWLEGVLGRRLPRTLRVREDVHESIREIYGEPYAEYAHALTTMAVDEIVGLAGIEFRRTDGGLEWSSDHLVRGRGI